MQSVSLCGTGRIYSLYVDATVVLAGTFRLYPGTDWSTVFRWHCCWVCPFDDISLRHGCCWLYLLERVMWGLWQAKSLKLHVL